MTPAPMSTIATAMIIRSVVSHPGMRPMAWSSRTCIFCPSEGGHM
jgi:hypothetical protein